MCEGHKREDRRGSYPQKRALRRSTLAVRGSNAASGRGEFREAREQIPGGMDIRMSTSSPYSYKYSYFLLASVTSRKYRRRVPFSESTFSPNYRERFTCESGNTTDDLKRVHCV